MMDETFPFDAFKLCWDVIFEESAKCESRFFNAGSCKILDSRDTNFESVENRLAYVYKYGYFNILFFEKCFLHFINECSEVLFPFENLKICSLSNGPGFDIIGLLRALSISNKPLKCLPMFNAINVNASWSELYKELISKSYKICITRSFLEYFYLNPNNVNITEGDVYSTLSSDSKNCISNSNVLLMVNVFASSKATPSTFESSLKEIFTLLRPGSLIFFVGSKNKIKLFSEFTVLKQYVKCVYGPQKVTLNNLPINEQISNIIGVKPCDSGHANFAVWQKRNEILRSIEGEPNFSEEGKFTLECKDDSDTISELSYSSFNGKSEESKNDLKTLDKLDFSPEEAKAENKLHSSPLKYNVNVVENSRSILSDIRLKLHHEEQDVSPSNSHNASNSNIKTLNSISHSFVESTFLVKDNKVLEAKEKLAKENGINFENAEGNSTGNIDGKLSSVNQIMIATAEASQNTLKKKSRRKKVKSVKKIEDQPLDGNDEKDNHEHHNTSQKSSSSNDSYANPTTIETRVTTPYPINIERISCTSNNVQSLLQRCESLILKLEEMTVDIKSEFSSSRKGPVINKTNFCNQQAEKHGVLHHCCCYLKTVHCCCCRKFCR